MPDTRPPFRFWRFFFSPHGRVSRKAIWYFVIPIQAALSAASWLATDSVRAAIDEGYFLNSPVFFAKVFEAAFALLMLWPMFAVVSKRLHDLGWTAAFGIAPFVTFLGVVQGISTTPGGSLVTYPIFSMATVLLTYCNLALIALLAILPGTKDANRFGAPVDKFALDVTRHF